MTRTAATRGSPASIPQGLTPFTTAADLYMRGLCWMEEARYQQSLGTRLVSYADDLVILCRKGSASALAT